HGAANAILLPTVEEYNIISNPQRFADIAEFMGENTEGLSTMEAAQLAIHALRDISEDVGIPSTLEEMGVKEEDFELMAENALKDGNAFSNKCKGTKEYIIELFKKSYYNLYYCIPSVYVSLGIFSVYTTKMTEHRKR